MLPNETVLGAGKYPKKKKINDQTCHWSIGLHNKPGVDSVEEPEYGKTGAVQGFPEKTIIRNVD